MTAASAANLRTLQALLLKCQCGALVQYSAALRQAKRHGRLALHQGDGCASQCGRHNQNPARRLATQARWETEILRGRPLIAWPATRSQHQFTLLLPQ